MSRDPVDSEQDLTRARLAAIVASSADAVVSETLDGVITDWNAAAERIYGYRADEVVGRRLSTLIPPERMPEATEILARVRGGESVEDVETVRCTRDGRHIDISLTVSPIRDETGQVVGTSAIERDITARKAAKADLAASAALFRTAFEDAPIGMALFRRDRTTLQVNRSLCDLLGYSEAELLATRFLDITHPDDRAVTMVSVERAFSGEADTYQYEKRYLRKDGRAVWIIVSGSLVRDDSGAPLYFASQMLDITARKEAEIELAAAHQHTRQVLERITDCFVAVDRDWRFTYVNAAAEQLMHRCREDLLGESLWEAFPRIVDTPLYALYQRAMADGVVANAEIYYPPLDGWYEVRAYPSSDGLSIFLRDVTENRILTRELRESEEKYRALMQQLPAVVYVLAVDGDQRPIYFSPYLADLTGFTPEEAMAREGHWLDWVHPGDRDRVAAADARAMAAGEPLRIEYRYRRKDGTYVWVLDESILVRDERGKVISIQGVLLDISDRVEAEEERARLASIVASAEDGILSCTLDGIITSWNRGAERLYGYTAEEAIGKDVMMLRPPELADETAAQLDSVRHGRSLLGHQTVRMTRDRRRIDISLSLSPIRDASGNIVGVASISRDITALLAAERNVWLRDRAIAAAPNGIVITDATRPGTLIVDVNPAFEALSGYTREDVIGRTINVLRGKETDPAATARIQAAIDHGEDVTETLLNYRKDGTPYLVELHLAAVRDAAGALTHVVGILTDVTERVQAEQELARERDLLRTLLEHLPDAVYVKDTASRFVQLNKATARQLGLADPEEAIGKTDRDFILRSLAEEYLADERRLFATGQAMLNKAERQVAGGGERWVLATKAPLRDASGTIVGLVGINRDVTERFQAEAALRASEARFRGVWESMLDAMALADSSGMVLAANPAFLALTGFSAEEIVGRHFARIFPEADRAAYQDGYARFFSGPDATATFETTIQREDGVPREVACQVSFIEIEGTRQAMVAAIRDVTERNRLDRELRGALEAAQAATRTKSLFLAMMSHELRTPLQAVLGYADLLLLETSGSLSAEQSEDLGHIQRGARRMIVLIDQMLDLSRMEAGRLELASRPVDLAQIAEEVRQDIAPQAEAKGLGLAVELPPDLPLVLGDSVRLRQILLNLAGNAVKFTERGSVRIAARADGGQARIAVSDTGIGISAEALPHIFEEFRQVDGNLTRRYGGAGLGLAIAKRLAEQMGGELSVMTAPGKGSTFTVALPVAPGDARKSGRRQPP